MAATGYNLLSETLNDLNLVGQGADGEKRMEVGGGQNEYALMGFFGRLNYDYKGKYLVEASGRYDGTSRFKRGQRWGFFPSFSLGWRVSEEPSSTASATSSTTSNCASRTANWATRTSVLRLYPQNLDRQSKLLVRRRQAHHGDHLGPVASTSRGSERIHKNLGVDMSFLNNRLAFSADFYIRDTKDMLTAASPCRPPTAPTRRK